jgi:hypothetical protein
MKYGDLSMADHSTHTARGTSKANAAAINNMVKFCGIALCGKDFPWVSTTGPAEVKRLVNGFCAKKLGLDAKAAEAAVHAVDEK